MAKGILGTKIGMTQIFTEEGKLVPVTVISCEPNVVLQKKTVENDGYESIQLGYKDKRVKLANKPELGHLAKANSNPKRYLREVRGQELYNFEVGQEIKVNIFTEGELVDVTGTSKGKGFQGVMKKYNFHGGPASHGSHHKREPGSVGACASPGRIQRGKKLPGRMGGNVVTLTTGSIVYLDKKQNIIGIKGAVPGSANSLVTIKKA